MLGAFATPVPGQGAYPDPMGSAGTHQGGFQLCTGCMRVRWPTSGGMTGGIDDEYRVQPAIDRQEFGAVDVCQGVDDELTATAIHLA